MNTPLKIAVAGLGTVGAGLVRLLHERREALALQCGKPILVTAVSARDKSKDRGLDLQGMAWFDDAETMAREADAEVVVELIGGSDGAALDLCKSAISAGRHVVTANKALIAHHGLALAEAAEAANVSLAYEAAVAGGIPIIKALREGLAGNAINGLYGILNGTCNYILSEMRETGREFDDVLADAQRLGYAEADPGFDVDGVDAAHKLAILTSVAFGCRINFDDIAVEGIRHISALDIRFANELGYRIKLLGITRRTALGVEQRVHPCMVQLDSPIAHVEGVFNAVVAQGDFVGSTVYEGRGAGEGPTASAVAADLVDIARGTMFPTFGVPVKSLKELDTVPMDQHRGAYYIRLMVVDRPGVFADVAAVLRDEQVSMESILQHTRAPGELVPVVMTTHEVSEESMRRAIDQFAAFDTVVEPPRMIRIEPLTL
ncbi:MAG: homoserine dehydrogenase [Rhodospirillaceae bacterium]|nr:homoserine dehydrogenase [Rhodospirillaceae bacterium]